MHFQLNKDNFYPSILRVLRQMVPDFVSSFDDGEEIYPIIGEFGGFVVKNAEDKGIMTNAFKFINLALQKGSAKTEDLIVLQVFQQIYANEVAVEEVKPFLNEHSNPVFLEFYRKYKGIILP